MPLVNVMVNNKAYTIACDDGEEDHLRQLAAIVDGKVRELLGSVGNVGDLRLLLMASLLIADEHHGGRLEADHHAAEAQLRSELEARAKAAESRAVAAMEQVTAEGQLRGDLEARAKAAESRATAAMEQVSAEGQLRSDLEARIQAAEDRAAAAMEQTAAKLERVAASLAAA
jgi:cell division protein ZapA